MNIIVQTIGENRIRELAKEHRLTDKAIKIIFAALDKIADEKQARREDFESFLRDVPEEIKKHPERIQIFQVLGKIGTEFEKARRG